MTLGAVVGTFVLNIGTGAGGFLPFAHQSAIPSWFVVVFLLFAIVQLFGINSLDMYSSGVTLQAIGVPVKRYQAVLIDCVIAFGVTMWAIFSSSFTQYLSDFVDIVIVWIAPWCAIFLVDWVLRRYRYVPSELQKTGRDSLYWRKGGIFWPALVAQVVGMFAAISALSATFHLPHWLNEVTVPHPRRLRLRRGLQHLPRHGRRGARLRGPGLRQGAQARPTRRRRCCEEEGLLAGREPTGASVPVLDEAARRRRGGTAAWRRGCAPARRPRRAPASTRRPRS